MYHIHIMSSVGKCNNYVLDTLKCCRYAVRKTWTYLDSGGNFFFFFFTGCAAKGTPQTPTIYIQNHKPQTHVPCINNNIFTQTLQTEIFFSVHCSKQI